MKRQQATCECADKGCPVHCGTPKCSNLTSTRVYRVDMEDRIGTRMCAACAEDAAQSGLFVDYIGR